MRHTNFTSKHERLQRECRYDPATRLLTCYTWPGARILIVAARPNATTATNKNVLA